MTQRKLIVVYWMLREVTRFGKGLIAPDLVAAAWIMRGTNLGLVNSLPLTGKPIKLRGTDLIRIAEGGVCLVEGYFDSRELLQELHRLESDVIRSSCGV